MPIYIPSCIFGGIQLPKWGVTQQTHSVRLHAIFHLDRFIVSSLRGETPKFRLFSILTFCGGA